MSDIEKKIILQNRDTESPSLLPAIVCYADILGFRALTEHAYETGKGTEFLQKVKNALAEAYETLRKAQTFDGLADPVFGVKAFTDNIVVAYPVSSPDYRLGEPELYTLLSLFAHVQARLVVDKFLLRGGIAFGDHYQDDNIVFGKAFLDAVDLDESEHAPRLVVASSVESLVSKHLSLSSDNPDAPLYKQLLEDPSDERLFINYLWSAFEHFPPAPIDSELLASHRDFVLESLNKHQSDPSVRAKYEWMAVYHNYVCHAIVDQYPDEGGDADGEYVAQVMEAQSALDHLVPCEGLPSVQRPRPIDAQRLRERLAGCQDSGDIS